MHKFAELAKKSVEAYVKSRIIISTPEPPDSGMVEKAGVFVSIKKHGDLRGCIGTYAPCQENVAIEIIRNAISAATQDPRFQPVTERELSELDYSVDVLTPPEKVKDIRELDHKEFGVILKSGPKRGLLLPDLEGVDSVEEQLKIVRMKAGILPSEQVEIFRFRVKRYR
jgi:hypothetical protein